MQDCLCRQQGGGHEVECPLDREKLSKSEVTLRVLLIYSLGNQFPNACKHSRGASLTSFPNWVVSHVPRDVEYPNK